MHFCTYAASNHCCPVLEKGVKVLYCVAVDSSSMAVGMFLGNLLSVQVLECCFESCSTSAVLDFRLSKTCCFLARAEGLAALSELLGESPTEISAFVGLRCSNLFVATSNAEVPSAAFLHPKGRLPLVHHDGES